MPFETEVIDTIYRTHDVKSIRFAKPSGFDYLAGQFMFITLGNADQMTKHFTISSSPTESFLEITKRLTGHPFANALDALSVGDKISLEGPYGDFTFKGEYLKLGMLSGGIGITPLRSMIKYSTDKRLETDIILLYSNSNESDIPFKDDLEDMEKQNPNIKVINTITKPGPGWRGATGRINADMVRKLVPDYLERTFYSSGPQKMVDAMVSILKEIKVPDKMVKQEFFPGYD